MRHFTSTFPTKSIILVPILISLLWLGISCESAPKAPVLTGVQRVNSLAISWTDSIASGDSLELNDLSLLSGYNLDLGAYASQFQPLLDSSDARAFDPIERWAYSSGFSQSRLAEYLYLWQMDTLRLHSYAAHRLDLNQWGGPALKLEVKGNYPFEETFQLILHPAQPDTFSLWLRIPGWAAYNEPGYQETYRYAHFTNRKIVLSVNGEYIWPPLEKGYAKLRREWKDGDVIELSFPLSLRKVQDRVNHPGKIAFMRGPVVLGAADSQPDSLAPLWRLSGTVLIWQDENQSSTQQITTTR